MGFWDFSSLFSGSGQIEMKFRSSSLLVSLCLTRAMRIQLIEEKDYSSIIAVLYRTVPSDSKLKFSLCGERVDQNLNYGRGMSVSKLGHRFAPAASVLVGRVYIPMVGPAVVARTPAQPEVLVDITTREFPTVAEILSTPQCLEVVKDLAERQLAAGAAAFPTDEILENSDEKTKDECKPWLLSPSDLQAVKACGVTFVRSMLERVIEEASLGDRSLQEKTRMTIMNEIGGMDLGSIVPGSVDAERARETLQRRGLWSQYLEVGLGPDAEVFTKAQPLSSVGTGSSVGIHSSSDWNNPEPELVLAISPAGSIVGATLGNDVNLRDVEGRSALLLGKAKDNNASAALGPMIRLIDGDDFSLDTLRNMDITLEVDGSQSEDGVGDFHMSEISSVSEISRDITDLVAQAMDEHFYPDGFMLYTGTMFSPVIERPSDSMGNSAAFTHFPGDVVTISSYELGALSNRVALCNDCPPWTMGVSQLMHNLAGRELL